MQLRQNFPFEPPRPVSKNQFCRLVVTYLDRGHLTGGACSCSPQSILIIVDRVDLPITGTGGYTSHDHDAYGVGTQKLIRILGDVTNATTCDKHTLSKCVH